MKSKSRDWGRNFAELDVYFEKLQSHADSFDKIKRNIGQAALKRFPYVIVYEIIKSEVIVFRCSIQNAIQNSGSKVKNPTEV